MGSKFNKDPFCSSLNPWEQRLLIPDFLRNIYNSIIATVTGTENIPQVSKVLWCLVNLLQDDDDGVRRGAASVILDITQYQYKDTTPELVLDILLPHLVSTSPQWILLLLQWITQSEIQDLMTSHYFEQYKSDGYAATRRVQKPAEQEVGVSSEQDVSSGVSSPPGESRDSSRVSSPDSSHPLFEPDLVNSFAEPLFIPYAVEYCFENLETIVKSEESHFPSEDLRALSKSVFADFKRKLNCMSSEENTVRNFVLKTKFNIFANSIKKIEMFYKVSLDEEWTITASR